MCLLTRSLGDPKGTSQILPVQSRSQLKSESGLRPRRKMRKRGLEGASEPEGPQCCLKYCRQLIVPFSTLWKTTRSDRINPITRGYGQRPEGTSRWERLEPGPGRQEQGRLRDSFPRQ